MKYLNSSNREKDKLRIPIVEKDKEIIAVTIARKDNKL